ncbi:hypothetical protein G5I_03730 [Acromyrmex echinatior]|uniref:Uncharacterized protein n=1 Tax=Acromyrmex echinatior TaxID=103372 RepID=F4WDR9_ACREC|nr:hypothetical protein G5I_03730 [Acromyrmex echinatior]
MEATSSVLMSSLIRVLAVSFVLLWPVLSEETSLTGRMRAISEDLDRQLNEIMASQALSYSTVNTVGLPYNATTKFNPKGMGQLYNVTNIFIDLVQSKQAYPEELLIAHIESFPKYYNKASSIASSSRHKADQELEWQDGGGHSMPQGRREPRIGASRPRGGPKRFYSLSNFARQDMRHGHDAVPAISGATRQSGAIRPFRRDNEPCVPPEGLAPGTCAVVRLAKARGRIQDATKTRAFWRRPGRAPAGESQ